MATSGGIGSKAEMLSPDSLGDPKLMLLRFDLTEALSQPFELRLELASEKPAIDTAAAIGEPLGVKITLADGTVRHLHGRIASAALLGSLRANLYRYEAVVRPGFWFLRYTRHSRVFEKQDVVAIVKTVLDEAAAIGVAVDAQTKKTYPKRPYCVQYDESDFDFVTRLLEQEGAYYFFEHAAGSHSMVLADSAGAHKPLIASAKLDYLPGASKAATDADGVLEWVVRDSVGSAKFALRDFDFERSATKLDATAQASSATGPKSLDVELYGEGYRFEGADKGGPKEPPDQQAKHFAYVLAAQRDASARQIDAATDALAMACGRTFEVAKLPAAKQDGKYLCTRTQLVYQQGYGDGMPGNELTSHACTFGALSSSVLFRPERSVPWPRMHGPQTAIVIGSGEIDPDEYGRVKVRFHWGHKERSSAWVRVSHPWAGKGFGMIALPRVGDEVVVDFLDGDPDHPLITGRVYNAQSMPPYDLPARKTVSGIRTRSSEKGSADNFNELRFDDKKGDEHVWLQAEKIFHRHVKLDAFDVVGQDEHFKITRDRIGEIGRDLQVAIGQHAVLKVAGDAQVDIAKDTLVNIGAHLNATVASDMLAAVTGKAQVKVGGDLALDVGANAALTAASNLDLDAGQNVAVAGGMKVDLKAGMTIVIEAGMQMTLKAGAGTITLGPAGVTIDGPLVKINCGGGGSSAAAAKKAAKAAPKKPKAPKAPTAQKDPLKS